MKKRGKDAAEEGERTGKMERGSGGNSFVGLTFKTQEACNFVTKGVDKQKWTIKEAAELFACHG
ncbi:MAG: hypothetical protein MJK18_13465 [Bdellovibrionales bacterium]|nr:hypothetical protein [Bdellovibrionales bacterium]